MGNRLTRLARAGGRRARALAALCALVPIAWLCLAYAPEIYRHARWSLENAGGGVKTAARKASGFFLAHPYFAIREVKVLGAEKVKGADIVVMSGLGAHTRIWSIDPTELEERVRRHPWVKTVLIRRELPARLVIAIEEWRPAAIVALDKLYYVSGDGVIFKALDEEESVDFPFITGLRAAQLPPREPATQEKLSQAVALGRTVERKALGVSEIRFRPGGGLVLYPVSYPVPFHMGWGDWDEKLSRLQWFLKEFQGREARFRAVDLSFRGRVVARRRGRA